MDWRNIFEHFFWVLIIPHRPVGLLLGPLRASLQRSPDGPKSEHFHEFLGKTGFLDPFVVVATCSVVEFWCLRVFFCWMSWGFLKLLEDVLRRLLALATHVHCAKFWGHWFETGFEGTRHGDALFSKCQGFNLHVLPDCSRASPRMLSMHE